jgi:hypothetical protein
MADPKSTRSAHAAVRRAARRERLHNVVWEAMTMKDWFLADLNLLSPADRNATPWVSTPDGSWTRLVGAGVNPDIPPPIAVPRPGRPPSSQVQGEGDARRT